VNIDRAVLTLAGGMVLISVGLAWLISPYWLFLAAFVGANLLQASFTGWCPAALIFRSLGMKNERHARAQRPSVALDQSG
jgi:hypothetical protein